MHTNHRRPGILALCAALLGCDADSFAPAANDQDDRGLAAVCGYRTQTQYDWGPACTGDKSSAPCLRDAHFTTVLHDGLILGCGVLTANLENAAAVRVALPTTGTARALEPDESGGFDGVADPVVGTAFFGRVAALGLNLAFDDVPDYNPNHPGPALASLIVSDDDSPCHGMTVQQVYQEANAALGDCPADLGILDLESCVNLINGAFRHGVDPNGVPECSGDLGEPFAPS